MTTNHDPNLAPWVVVVGDLVEVELLVIGQPTQVGPVLIEGEVVGGTTKVLVLDTTRPKRRVRVAWGAVATIRDAVTTTPHPAL